MIRWGNAKPARYRKETDLWLLASIFVNGSFALYSVLTSNVWGFIYACIIGLTLALPRNRSILGVYWQRAKRARYQQVRVEFTRDSAPVGDLLELLQMVYRREVKFYDMLSQGIRSAYPEIEYFEIAPDTTAISELIAAGNPVFRSTLWFSSSAKAVEFKLRYGDEIVFL